MDFKILTKTNLDEFVRLVDTGIIDLNIMNCDSQLPYSTYQPTCFIDTKLEPTSPRYTQQQLRLYEEISGIKYDESSCEQLDIDTQVVINSPTPYPWASPLFINKNMHCMSRFVNLLNLDDEKEFLELGSGWGFCCEYLAQLKHRVTGIDINSKFINASISRASSRNYPINYLHTTFSSFNPDKKFDVIYAYQAFHHSDAPLKILDKYVHYLSNNGVFALVSEPFIDNCSWKWPHWGMRLDPISIYSIKKFGWFESGWTISYMKSLFRLAGLSTSYIVEPNNDLTHFLFGKKTNLFGNYSQLNEKLL